MGWVHPGRERSSRLVCVEASEHALHVYIHTHRLYIHTYILTDKYIHTPIHACTYRHAPPTHRGAGHTIHTHIHTYIQIHTYIHTCMYIQTRPPTHRGGGGKTTCPPYIQKPVHPDPLGGGWGVGPAALDHVYITVNARTCQTSYALLPRKAFRPPTWAWAVDEVALLSIIGIPRSDGCAT